MVRSPAAVSGWAWFGPFATTNSRVLAASGRAANRLGLDHPGDIDIERHPALLRPLTGDPQPAAADLDIGDVECQDLARTQPAEQHQSGDGPVPPGPQASQQVGGLAPVQRSWQSTWLS